MAEERPKAEEKPENKEVELQAKIEHLEQVVAEQARLLAKINDNKPSVTDEMLLHRIEQLEKVVVEQAHQLELKNSKSTNEIEAALLARIEQLEHAIATQTSKVDTALNTNIPETNTSEARLPQEPETSRIDQLEKHLSDLQEKNITFNIDGEWGYGRTDNKNNYAIGSTKGRYDNTLFGLVASLRPYNWLSVNSRVEFEDDKVDLDWVFAELRQSDQLRFRIGRVKQPFGLYGEIEAIGTLRPFFTLPLTVYGATRIASVAYEGVGITGSYYGKKGWGVGYDAYMGQLVLEGDEPFLKLLDLGSLTPGTKLEPQEDEKVTDTYGGRLTFFTPVQGLSFGLSAYKGKIGEERARKVTYGGSVEYLTDKWSIRSEYFKTEEDEIESNLAERTRAGYIEIARRFGPWQLAGRFERLNTNFAGFNNSSSLLKHREGAFGINYFFTPNIVTKFSYHTVKGNRFAVPELLDDALINNRLNKRTNLVEFGLQFAF